MSAILDLDNGVKRRTFPQLLLLLNEMVELDTSLANNTGHFNLLTTVVWDVQDAERIC